MCELSKTPICLKTLLQPLSTYHPVVDTVRQQVSGYCMACFCNYNSHNQIFQAKQFRKSPIFNVVYQFPNSAATLDTTEIGDLVSWLEIKYNKGRVYGWSFCIQNRMSLKTDVFLLLHTVFASHHCLGTQYDPKPSITAQVPFSQKNVRLG